MPEMSRLYDDSWRDLIARKHEPKRNVTKYRIVLKVRGTRIVKEYTDKNDYRMWRETYEHRMSDPASGIEDIKTEFVYA